MSWDNPSDLEMGYETRIGRRVYKTADPPQCTGCENLTAENEADIASRTCLRCTRNNLSTVSHWMRTDNYSLAGPDEPDESEEA